MITIPRLPVRKLNTRGISHVVLPLAVVAVLAIGATFVSVANKSSETTASLSSATAATTPKAKSYMLVFSDKGRYSHVNIKLKGTDVPHKCGKKLTEGTSVTKKLSSNKPLKLSCAPVGGGATYEVTFLKSKTVTANSPTIPVDISADYCTVVYRDVSKTQKVPVGPSGNCDTAADDKATQVESSLRVLPNLNKGNKSFKGYVEVYAAESLTKAQCGGTVTVRVEAEKKTDYALPLKYTKANAGERKGMGYCVAKLKKHKIDQGDSVSIYATYAGSPYLTAGSAEAKLVIPKSAP